MPKLNPDPAVVAPAAPALAPPKEEALDAADAPADADAAPPDVAELAAGDDARAEVVGFADADACAAE